MRAKTSTLRQTRRVSGAPGRGLADFEAGLGEACLGSGTPRRPLSASTQPAELKRGGDGEARPCALPRPARLREAAAAARLPSVAGGAAEEAAAAEAMLRYSSGVTLTTTTPRKPGDEGEPGRRRVRLGAVAERRIRLSAVLRRGACAGRSFSPRRKRREERVRGGAGERSMRGCRRRGALMEGWRRRGKGGLGASWAALGWSLASPSSQGDAEERRRKRGRREVKQERDSGVAVGGNNTPPWDKGGRGREEKWVACLLVCVAWRVPLKTLPPIWGPLVAGYVWLWGAAPGLWAECCFELPGCPWATFGLSALPTSQGGREGEVAWPSSATLCLGQGCSMLGGQQWGASGVPARLLAPV